MTLQNNADIIYYYRYSALGLVWAETRAQSGDWFGSGTLHPAQVLRGSLPLLSPAFFLDVPTFHHQVPPRPPRRERSQRRKWEPWATYIRFLRYKPIPGRRFTACKISLNGVEIVISAKLPDNISPTVPPSAVRLSRVVEAHGGESGNV